MTPVSLEDTTMKIRDRRRYEMLIRVRGFGAAHSQLFPSTSTAHDAFVIVAREIEQLGALDVAERSASQASGAQRKAAARQVLAATLTRAGLTARVLAKTNPQLDAQLQPPLPGDDVQLLTLARQFASRAAPYDAQFAGHGITIAEIEASTIAFEQAMHQRGMGHDDRVRARAGIESAFARAMDAVEALDVSVANCLGGDPIALAVWRHDRRIAPTRRSSAAPTEPVDVPAASAPRLPEAA